MARSPGCKKFAVKKGPWTPEEDMKLLAYIEAHGHGSWTSLPAEAGLQRCGKSCRLRWKNYLRPDIKRGKFSLQEEQSIIQLHALLGNRWSAITAYLPKRTDNEIKNHWNTHLKKRLAKMGIDPATHQPSSNALSIADGHSKNAANLSHMAQWESARLEAEARLARESTKLRSITTTSGGTTSFHATATPYLGAWQGVCSKTGKDGSPIDLESPTSTLSFSENGNINTTIRVETTKEVATRASGGGINIKIDADKIATNSWMEQYCGGLAPLFGSGGENPWPHEYSMKQCSGSLTEMLLEKESSSGGCLADSNKEVKVGGAFRPEIVNEVENKSYWNGILNLVSSGSAFSSPPLL